MDRKYIQQNNIEAKYLRNQLNNEELEAFEIYLMENPEVVDELEVESILEKQIPKVGVMDSQASPPTSLFNQIFHPKYLFPALSVLFCGLYLNSISSLNSVSTYQSAEIAFISPTRSLEQENKVNAQFAFEATAFNFGSQKQFVLVIEVPSSNTLSYQARVTKKVTNTDFKPIKIDQLTSNEQGMIVLPLKVNNFPPAIYKLELTTLANSNKPSDIAPVHYYFRTLKKD